MLEKERDTRLTTVYGRTASVLDPNFNNSADVSERLALLLSVCNIPGYEAPPPMLRQRFLTRQRRIWNQVVGSAPAGQLRQASRSQQSLEPMAFLLSFSTRWKLYHCHPTFGTDLVRASLAAYFWQGRSAGTIRQIASRSGADKNCDGDASKPETQKDTESPHCFQAMAIAIVNYAVARNHPANTRPPNQQTRRYSAL